MLLDLLGGRRMPLSGNAGDAGARRGGHVRRPRLGGKYRQAANTSKPKAVYATVNAQYGASWYSKRCTQCAMKPSLYGAEPACTRSHDSSEVSEQACPSQDCSTTTPIAATCARRNQKRLTHDQPRRFPTTTSTRP